VRGTANGVGGGDPFFGIEVPQGAEFIGGEGSCVGQSPFEERVRSDPIEHCGIPAVGGNNEFSVSGHLEIRGHSTNHMGKFHLLRKLTCGN